MSIILAIKATFLKCQRCGHEWAYKGKNEYVATCPHCRTYVTIKKHSILPTGKDCEPKQSVESIVIRSNGDANNHG